MHTDLTQQQITDVLERACYGHLACHDGADLYVVPITFVCQDNALIAYTREGRKIGLMRQHPKVCVQTEEVHGDGSWESVILWGTFEEITDRKEAQQACIMLADQFARMTDPGRKPHVSPLIKDIASMDWEKNAPVLYKIAIERSSGRAQSA